MTLCDYLEEIKFWIFLRKHTLDTIAAAENGRQDFTLLRTSLISSLFLRRCFVVQVIKSMSKVLQKKFLEDAHFVPLHQIINRS